MTKHISRMLIVFLVAGLAQAQVTPPIKPAANSPAHAWWSHIEFLADDKLLGRETGSAGHHAAAQYIAECFKRAGLQPAGTAGYLQPARFRSRRIIEEGSSLALVRSNGVTEPVALGDEAIFSMRIEHAPRLEAEIVFVGYGLSVPEMNYDDLANLDVRGKVVLLLSGGPASIPGLLRSHYQSVRWNALRRKGAVGVLAIQNPKSMDILWDRSKLARFMPALTLADPALDETAGQQLSVTINPSRAEKFFKGSGHTFKEIMELANSEKPLPKFAIPAGVRATVKLETAQIDSENVAGMLTGSDPTLKHECVVLSAHLDHIGVGQPINGDTIFNGAMDNASGIATLIETARTMQHSGKRLRRSVLFLAVTAEEKGLLGSRYFAAHPSVPISQVVANFNTDMFLPLFPLQSLIVQGLYAAHTKKWILTLTEHRACHCSSRTRTSQES